MKKGDRIYCINEATYSDHITKRNPYVIADIKEDQVRIKNDNQYLVWFPKYCFTKSKIPDITSITIDDKFEDSHNACVEVTITFSNREKRWTTFMTLQWLEGLFNEYQNYITGEHLIFVKEINEEKVSQIITDLDKQNELIEKTWK